MIKKILFSIAKSVLSWASTYIYDYVDKDDDGKISKEELATVYKQIKGLLSKIRKIEQ